MSYRDVEELLLERGLEVDHTTVNRWVLAYAPLIERRLRPFRKAHCGSVRVDETHVRIRGEWRYLYRAVDKHGEAMILPNAKRDLDAAKRFFRKMLKDIPLLSPDRIGTDGTGIYPGTTAAARKEGRLARDPVHHVTKHLQQGIESDHFRLKKNMPRVGGFQSFNTARVSIQKFEAMLWKNRGRSGQTCNLLGSLRQARIQNFDDMRISMTCRSTGGRDHGQDRRVGTSRYSDMSLR